MSISTRWNFGFLVFLILAGILTLVLARRSNPVQAGSAARVDGDAWTDQFAGPQTEANPRSSRQPGKAPFIVADTTTDSPGTNLVTRIVTFAAEIGGPPPLFQQWKVDKGGGFEAVSASATNPLLVISNARIGDTGRYALFATNAAGATNTTPVPLVVIEGAD